jgi:histone H3/H4
MDHALNNKKKIIQPDHCVSEGVEKCATYHLVKTLPAYKAVVRRQQRKAAYDTLYTTTRQEAMRAARAKARKTKKKYEPPTIDMKSFKDLEVEKEYAFTRVVKDNKGQDKTITLWYDIDQNKNPTDDNEINFIFYIGQVCQKIKKDHEDDKNEYDSVRVSANIKKFFSDLVMEFLKRIAPQIRIITEIMKVKTINEKVMETAIKLLLVDSYHGPSSGVIELSEQHNELFTRIENKVEIYKTHSATMKAKMDKDDDDLEDGLEGDLDGDLNEDIEEDVKDDTLDEDLNGTSEDTNTNDTKKEVLKTTTDAPAVTAGGDQRTRR